MTPRPCFAHHGRGTQRAHLKTPMKGGSKRLSQGSSSAKRILFPSPSTSSPIGKVNNIFSAVEQGNLQLVKDLIQHVGPAVRRPNRRCTLLHTAAASNQILIVSYLLDLISPNMLNLQRQTPSHIAAMKGHTKVLKALMADKEMNPDLEDLQHKTYKDWLSSPLFDAIVAGEKNKTKELVALGANPDCLLANGTEGVLGRELNIKTPRQLATTLERDSIVNLLPKVVESPCSPQNRSSLKGPPLNGHKIGRDTMFGPIRLKVHPAKKQASDGDAYKMEEGTKGYVCILSYGSFKGRPDLELEASEDDTRNFANVFGQMGHTGEVHESLTLKDTRETLLRVRDSKDLGDANSAIFIISSHGTSNQDSFLTSDMEWLSTKWILNLFNDAECPHLKDKPKLFFFDFSCGYYTDGNAADCQPFVSPRIQEPLRDLMCLYSSNAGFTSYNVTKDGSAFSTALCRTLAHYSHDMEFNDLYRELVVECKRTSPSLVPLLRNIGFCKKFYFNAIVSE